MESPVTNILPLRSPEPGRSGRRSFRELAEMWLSTEGLRLVEPKNERRHIDHMEALWHLTEVDLRPSKVKAALMALLEPNGPLAAPTVNKVRGTGRRIIREAQINDEWFGPNPFEVVQRLKEPKPDFRTLSLAEARLLLPHFRPDRRREALMMLYLGMRPGEWKALRREDVDFQRNTIIIRRSNGRNATKTGKIRTVPIPANLRPVLEEALRESPAYCPLVFPANFGKRQRADAKLSRMLQGVMRRAGLVSGYERKCRRRIQGQPCGYADTRQAAEPGRCPKCNYKLWLVGLPLEVRFYDLRHSAATLHREAGADPLAIQVLLGHAAENLTDGIYTHLSMDYLRNELGKLLI